MVYTYTGREHSDVLFETATTGKGAPPCRLVVSGDSGGYFAVLDSADTVLWIRPAPPPPKEGGGQKEECPAGEPPGGGQKEECPAGEAPAQQEGGQQQRPAVETS